MLYSEFIDRTGVEVSAAEWDVINVMYMQSDDDKDTFCAKWSRLNSARVKKARQAAKVAAQNGKTIEKFWSIIDRLQCANFGTPAVEVLTAKQIDYLQAHRVPLQVERMNYYTGTVETVNGMAYEVKNWIECEIKKLRMAV